MKHPLPRLASDAVEPSASTEENFTVVYNAEKANILVVDDHPDKLLVFETILEELGENVITARSGEEALRCMLEYEFAVILLDVKMPIMDGFETAALIRGRKKFAHTPIIFVTAYGDEMHTAEGYSLGAVDYILTPIMPDVLRTKVKVFVQLYRMTHQIKQQAEQRIALAQEQAARAAAEESIRRSTFLAEASQVLSSSLDVEATLRGLTSFVVPFLSDLCALALVDEAGNASQTQLAWTSGADNSIPYQTTAIGLVKTELVEAIARALTTTEPEVIELPGNEATLQVVKGEAAEQAVVELGFALQRAAIFPLQARGRKLGILLLGLSASRNFDEGTLALASDLAGRTAIALDNSLLYFKVQEADQRKDEFLAMLAHELRNPLAPIRSAVAVMRHLGNGDATLEWSRDIIDRQVEHMTRLVDDLLDVSRLTQGKIRLQKEPVALAAIIARAIETSRPMIESHKHRLTVTMPDEPIHLNGDSVRLAQVFANLLNNAAKYTQEGGAIEFTGELTDGYVVVRVKDNGSGIPADILPHVFDLFTQATRSLARSEGGLGIGLTLVRNLVERHGGSVEAKSNGTGEGSEFVVRLPVLQGAVAQPENSTETPTPVTLATRCRILLIDDNVDSNDALELLLRMYGHDIRKALDGSTALQIAEEFKPNLVLCDIGLPGMDGYEVIRRLRDQKSEPRPIVAALTGYAQSEDVLRTQEAGFDYHLVKPLDPDELKTWIAAQAQKFVDANSLTEH